MVEVGAERIGDGNFSIIAGPCSFESREHFAKTAEFLQKSQVNLIRGGIYKSRTRPESFQGLRESALSWLNDAKKLSGLSLVSEVTDPRQIEKLHSVVDCYQVGTRNMFNYELLKELGALRKPVILKRGFSALVDEWLLAAEYILRGGNDKVILCERGIRTFETITRNTLDLAAVAYLKAKTDFPVLVDPSHAAGVSELVTPLALAAKAAGADGLLIEIHPNPKLALSDGAQSLDFAQFSELLTLLKYPTGKLLSTASARI